VRDRWDAEALHTVRELTADLTSLLTSLEVARRRHEDDKAVQRSQMVALRMQRNLECLISLLRD
jgi:hypothetical protein